MPTVLITRPQAVSEVLAQELHDQGYAGVIEPLLTIVPTPTPPPALDSLQAVMITSMNALVALETIAPDYPLMTLPCFCVGPRTAENAESFGFTNVQSSTSDGAALAQHIVTTLTDKSKAIVHIAGQDIDSKAHQELEAAGFTIVTWVVYAATPSPVLSAHTARMLKQQKIDAVLVFSVRTAETLNALMKQHELLTCCTGLTAIGLSEAVAKALRPLPWKKVLVAREPNESAMITCLKDAHPIS